MSFWSNVTTGNKRVCWEWQGFVEDTGYGRTTFTGRKMYAHRVAFLIFNGYLTSGLVIRHKCDNRLCCNPHHLEEGTYEDNARDRERRKQRRGTSKVPPGYRKRRYSH